MSTDIFNQSWATFNSLRNHRYILYRCWNEDKHAAMVIGLNPSTADESQDDPTIGFIKRILDYNGYGALYMVNLFTYITQHLKELVHPSTCKYDLKQCKKIWIEASENVSAVIFAWGGFKVFGRDKEAIKLFPYAVCFDHLKNGSPRHAMYLKSTTKLKPFR